MSGFLRWLLCVCVTSLAVFIAAYFGVFTELYYGDATWISFGIIAWFAAMSLECGYVTYRINSVLDNYGGGVPNAYTKWVNSHKNGAMMAVERYHFCSGAFTTLGMIGTVIGFIMALPALSHIQAGDASSLTKVVTELTGGVCPALYTTLTGLICSLLLRIQSFSLSQTINSHSDEAEVLA